MATEYKLSYTASEIDNKLGKIDNLALKSEVPTKTSQLTNDKGYLTAVPSEYITETELTAKGYLTEHQSLAGYAKTADLGDLATKDTIAKTDLASDIQTSLEKADNAKSYTDTAISNLINSAPSTLDTLGEIAAAMQENADVVDALDAAIGTKADASEVAYIDAEDNEDITDIENSGTGGNNNPLYGKKISFNGDSICAGAGFAGGYGKIIAERNGMSYENIAHGGATITAETYSGSTGSPLHWISRTVANMDETADYAIIEGGVNDPNYVTNIGSLSKGYNAVLDDTTYYGAFESMLKQLATRFKGKKIGFIAVSSMSTEYYHIALECCAKWGVPVCDLKASTVPIGSISELSSLYTTDGTHPNEEGYKKYYCDQIESWLKNMVTSGQNSSYMIQKHTMDETAHADIRALINEKLNSVGVSFRRALLPLADGTTIEIDVLTALDGNIVVKCTNQVPISIDTDGNVFNEIGYQNGYRLSSSGVVKEHNPSTVTGFIPAKAGDIVRIGGVNWRTDTHSMNYICAYDSNFTFIGAVTGNLMNYSTVMYSSISSELETKYAELTLKADVANIAYIRVSTQGSTTTSVNSGGSFIGEDGANMIVTINQEIT